MTTEYRLSETAASRWLQRMVVVVPSCWPCKSSLSLPMPFVYQDLAIISNHHHDHALQIAVGCPRHRRGDPNFVLVLRRDITGVVGPAQELLSFFHFSLRYLFNSRPGAMPHQPLKVCFITGGGAAAQERGD